MILNLKDIYKKYNMNIRGVLHIGAHHGNEYKQYKELDVNNIVFFEPIPSVFKKLTRNVGEECVCHNIALGNDNKKIMMNISTFNDGASSSVLEPKFHLKLHPHIKFNKKIEVEMKRMVDVISRVEMKNYNFINIDVQGYEMEVLLGAGDLISEIDYIMAEVNRDEVYKNCTMINELDEYLSLFNFERVETNWAGKMWGDALYIKKKGVDDL